MKRGTPEHPKTEELALLLEIPVAHAVGLLEMLWHFTARYCARGDIGRFSDEVIARKSGWTGDAAEFISALREAKGGGEYGWIEMHEDYRLIVHDWRDHCDHSTEMLLKKKGLEFITGEKPFTRRLETVSKQVRNDLSQPLPLPLPKPLPEPKPKPKPEQIQKQTLSPIPPQAGAVRVEKQIEYSETFLAFWDAYPERKGKGAAWTAWQKIKTPKPDIDTVLDAIDDQAREKSALKELGEFCPNWKNPATWINQRCWEDEVTITSSALPPGYHITDEQMAIIDRNEAEIAAQKALEVEANA